jgi:hypothetical protein
MAVSKVLGRKAPSQDGTDFFEMKQQGGAYGSPSKVPEHPKSGKMREKIWGNPKLNKSQT